MNYLAPRSLFDNILFKDFFGDDFFCPLPSLKKIGYPVDIYETDDNLVLEVAAVGLDKSDIKVEIKDDILSISYNKKEEESERNYAYKGITKKSFNLAWRISDKFDLSNTSANLDRGLLKVIVPVAPERKPKEIEVTIS
ncbi:MAG TPA: Hsp20/alpha crystallin family protein [Bacteroidales bacterium]|nr:Hsp20/alpha crystallin family protein [Bacteroidales bacterium]